LENALIHTFEAANGSVINKERVIVASFNEKSLAIWLNIITVLESSLSILKKDAAVPSGCYVFVLGKDIPIYEMEKLCRELASVHGGSGIWCTSETRRALNPYAAFEGTEYAVRTPAKSEYIQIKHIEAVSRNIKRPSSAFPLSEKIHTAIRQETQVVLSGPRFIGKREGIFRYCSGLGNLPPLILRFRTGTDSPYANIGAFADILSPRLYAFLSPGVGQKRMEKLGMLQTLIFRERLRSEYSATLYKNICYFLHMMLETYIAEMSAKRAFPMLILENINAADETAARIFMEAWNMLPSKADIRVYGTYVGKNESDLQIWETVFRKVIVLPPVSKALVDTAGMSTDLWEMSYAFNILSKFFPGNLFPQLFEETGENPATLQRVFTLLTRIGAIDFIEDPVPRIHNFKTLAEKNIGERKELVRSLTRTSLLSNVAAGKLSACFNLLESIKELGGEIDDALAWNSIRADILNGTSEKIKLAIAQDRFANIVGKDREPSLRGLFQTFSSLVQEDAPLIHKTFADDTPEPKLTLYQIQNLMNRACYHLGVRQNTVALETLKKTMRLAQEQREICPAAVYRLISLSNLLSRKMAEAADYISIATEYAEKQAETDELGVSLYYEATIQYLFGNLSKAERLALNAERDLANTGRYDWADRARFLRGRLRLDFGFYQDALHLFERTMENIAGPTSKPMKDTLSAWIYRAKIFSGESPEYSGDNPDGLLFSSEAAYLRGDYQKAVSLSEKILSNLPGEGFLFTERPDWQSGFAQCELLLISEQDFWMRMASSYYSLSLCRLSPDMQKQALSSLGWLTPNELLPDTDPHDAFYFYALYRVLRESGAGALDTNTVIGMAFRRLQQRSIRIDDHEARRTFLTRPYWNSALYAAGKDHKLM
jgi:tetratricopeptide (TPR) repeat protein